MNEARTIFVILPTLKIGGIASVAKALHFEAILQGYDSTLLSFYSSGDPSEYFQKSKCAPCLKVAPLYEALAKRYEGKARFFKVDADSSPEALSVMKANGIRSVPTFHVWRLGTRIDSIQGSHIDEVEALIEGELKKMKG